MILKRNIFAQECAEGFSNVEFMLVRNFATKALAALAGKPSSTKLLAIVDGLFCSRHYHVVLSRLRADTNASDQNHAVILKSSITVTGMMRVAPSVHT